MARADLTKQAQDVAGMFDDVAPAYDFTNDVLSMGMDRLWRKATFAAVNAKPGELVLDLAAGTGTSSQDYADAGIDVIPCDFSEGMVKVGKQRHPHLPFVVGDAMALPFADETFDAVTISFGLRNVQVTAKGLHEMLRVTKPGGRIVVCEFSSPPNAMWREMYSFYRDNVLPRVASLIASNVDAYSYLSESIAKWPSQEALAHLIQEVGWRQVEYRNLTGGIVALHRAWRP